MHTTLEYYAFNYNGNKFNSDDAVSFAYYCNLASSYIDQYTFDRIKEDTDKVQMATCELIDFLFNQNEVESNMVASEHLGNRSVTYKTSSSNTEKSKNIRNIVMKWLGNSNLLYIGTRYV